MAQQTAVNFLLRELRIEDLAKGEQLSVVLHICEEAKQMEKEQIMNAWYNGFEENRPYVDHSEDYYNQTYGENKN